jgi:hypothetical protein
MKTVEAVILTFNLDRVKQELHALGLNDMTLSEAPSLRVSSFTEPAVPPAAFLPRIQVRLVVPDISRTAPRTSCAMRPDLTREAQAVMSGGALTSQSTGPELAMLASAGDRERSAYEWPSRVTEI